MSDKKIHIWSKPIKPNSQGVVKLTPKALELVADIATETGRPMRDIVSQIVIQAVENELIVYDREEG